MINKKRSFFERLSGAAGAEALDPFEDDVLAPVTKATTKTSAPAVSKVPLEDDRSGSGQLPVDVHQTNSDIIIRAFVAGVRPDELSISISRDMVEIEGSRMEREQVSAPDYYTRELFWGSFSRVIQLPEEVDVESSSASAKDGLLTLVLPKLDKAKQTKLRVKAG